MTNKITWTDEQLDIFEAVPTQPETNFVVRALAGTGKSTMLRQLIVEFTHENIPPRDVVVLAFNSITAEEMSTKLPKGYSAKTFHSLGLSALRTRDPYLSIDDRGQKTFEAIKSIKGTYGYIARIRELVSWAKNTLTLDRDTLAEVARRKCLNDDKKSAWDLADIALEVVQQTSEDTARVDFDDMIFLPVVNGWRPKQYKHLLLDETQDLNPCQLELVRLAKAGSGRIVAVGDQNQAIYGWRGAGSNVMDNLVRELNAQVLPLTVGYRCGRVITELAREVVSDYKAHENNGEGAIKHVEDAREAAPGDMYLSRTNAPLISVWKDLTRRGVPATIRGKDIAKVLGRMIENSNAETTTELRTWLIAETEKREKLAKENEDRKALNTWLDYQSCLVSLSEDHDLVSDLRTRLDSLFSKAGKIDSRKVVLSTVHKAKGLEADRVFVDTATFRRGETQEEENLWYVAITRAKAVLFLVSPPEE